jgi:hypothetical protein
VEWNHSPAGHITALVVEKGAQLAPGRVHADHVVEYVGIRRDAAEVIQSVDRTPMSTQQRCPYLPM